MKKYRHSVRSVLINLLNDRFLDPDKRRSLVKDLEATVEKRWRPEFNEKYWYADSVGDADYFLWGNDVIDIKHLTIGNCFPTREAAQAAAEKIKKVLKNID